MQYSNDPFSDESRKSASGNFSWKANKILRGRKNRSNRRRDISSLLRVMSRIFSCAVWPSGGVVTLEQCQCLISHSFGGGQRHDNGECHSQKTRGTDLLYKRYVLHIYESERVSEDKPRISFIKSCSNFVLMD